MSVRERSQHARQQLVVRRDQLRSACLHGVSGKMKALGTGLQQGEETADWKKGLLDWELQVQAQAVLRLCARERCVHWP